MNNRIVYLIGHELYTIDINSYQHTLIYYCPRDYIIHSLNVFGEFAYIACHEALIEVNLKTLEYRDIYTKVYSQYMCFSSLRKYKDCIILDYACKKFCGVLKIYGMTTIEVQTLDYNYKGSTEIKLPCSIKYGENEYTFNKDGTILYCNGIPHTLNTNPVKEPLCIAQQIAAL